MTFDAYWLIFSMTFHPYGLIFFSTEGIILHGVFGRLETESVEVGARLAHPARHVWRHPPFNCKGSGWTNSKHVWKLIFTERVISGWCGISGSLDTIFYSLFFWQSYSQYYWGFSACRQIGCLSTIVGYFLLETIMMCILACHVLSLNIVVFWTMGSHSSTIWL